MADYEIGQRVKLNGKTYKIDRPFKRSWILTRNGKEYKATSAMMNKIKDQNERGIGTGNRRKRKQKSDKHYMMIRVDYRNAIARACNQPEKPFPSTEKELMNHLEQISCDLSPENLHCDGEISRTQAMKKYRMLKAEWKEVEKIIGRKVSEDEVWDYMKNN